LTPWDQGGFGRETGLFEQGEAVWREKKLGGFAAVSGSEKVAVERESFGSGEVAQFIGFIGLPRKHRKLCRFRKMLIPVTKLTTCSHIFNKQ